MTTSIAIPESAERAPVNTVADILRAMARDPAVAEAVRQHVLDEELRRLPAAFLQLSAKVEQHIAESSRTHTELRAGQASLEAGQARLEAGQEELRAGQARHDSDISELRTGQEDILARLTRLEIGQDELRAKATVTDARKMMGSFCGLLNLRRPRWLDDHELFALIEDGDEAVIADIPDNELRSCQATDLTLSATSKADGSRQYVLVECSAGITRNDILRIRRNADHFARITGCVTHAAAVGRLPPPGILDTAREMNVHCLEPTAKVTRPT